MLSQAISPTYMNQQWARVLAALPGGGAYDAAPLELQCSGFQAVTLFTAYTRGAAGGDVRLRVDYSYDGTTYYQRGVYAPGAVASGADTVGNVQRGVIEYGSTAAGAERAALQLELDGTVEFIRVACAESGAVGNPGTCGILASFA